MEVVYKDGVKYFREEFLLESDFEKVVLSQYKYIFGEKAILFDKSIIRTVSGIGTIPDAFILNPDQNKWYVIEVELACHSVHNHIVPQISKFRSALKNDRKKLLKFFDLQIENDLRKKADWLLATGHHSNIHRTISELIDREPEIIIIIDEITDELLSVKDDNKFNINIFKCFGRDKVGKEDAIYLFDTILTSKQSYSRVSNKALKIASQQIESSMKEIEDPLSVLPEAATEIHNNSRIQGQSPSPTEWTVLVPELHALNKFNNWKNLCEHLSVDYGVDSARRALQRWVKKNRPDWPPIP